MKKKPRTNPIAMILVPIVVSMVVGAFLMLGYLLTMLFKIPLRLELPVPLKLLGAGLLTVALGLGVWLFRFRTPVDVLVSTYVTFSKLFRGFESRQDSERTEPLVVRGPYKLVRHPLYLAVLLSLVGFGLLLDLSFVLLAAAIAFVWFDLVLMPYEEKELLALFGTDYEQYMKRVRRLVPIPRRSTSDLAR